MPKVVSHDRIIDLHLKGHLQREIAAQVGCDEQTVWRVVKDYRKFYRGLRIPNNDPLLRKLREHHGASLD